MAVQDLVIATLVPGAEDSNSFLADKFPRRDGAPRRTKRLKSTNQREQPIDEIWDREETDGLPCRLSLLDILCWENLTCTSVAEVQEKLKTLEDVPDAILKAVSLVENTCEAVSHYISAVVDHAVSDSSQSDSSTIPPASSPSITVSSISSYTVETGTPYPSPSATVTSINTQASFPDQPITNTATMSMSGGGINLPSVAQVHSGSDGSSVNNPGGPNQFAPTADVTTRTPTDSLTIPRSPSTTSTGPSLTSTEPTTLTKPPPSPSLAPGGLIPSASESLTPQDPRAHHHNSGAILAIILGVLALLLCIAFAVLFFLRRRARARRTARRAYTGSPWQRLKLHMYDGSSSRPESSIWTWFGSIPIDTEYKPTPEPRPYSPESNFAEKGAVPPAASRGLVASSPHPSPCPSPAPSDIRRSLARSLHEGLPYLTVPVPSPLEASSSSTELLALAGTDYAVANPFSDVHEVRVGRSMSGVSRTTASSNDVESVEAL